MFCLKKKCAFFLCALFCICSGFAQLSAQQSDEAQAAVTEEGLFPSSEAENPETALAFEPASGIPQGQSSRFGTFFLFLRMIIVLALVVACIYGVMWFMKKSMRVEPVTDDPFLRKVSSVDLAVGKSVQIVTLLDHAYIVGVADGSVSLLGTVDDKELVDAMNLYADEHQNVKKPRSFSDILDIFMPNGPKEKGGVLAGTQSTVSELLKKQRDRLNSGE